MTPHYLAIFHHNRHNDSMKVAEKDKVISGMLLDELKRCQEMLHDLEKSVSVLPRGALNKRKKRYKDKVYNYYCLKYREGKKVISKHIPSNELEGIVKQLELRKKYEKEIGYYKKRIVYLNKILGSGKRAG